MHNQYKPVALPAVPDKEVMPCCLLQSFTEK
ncbi:MAG: hypothetical protein K0R57_2197 [Paenibacillaceae bacterium]|jgi:hypothetical protein|nr:hypothetical protein [Paenibacillaceae bacterium]